MFKDPLKNTFFRTSLSSPEVGINDSKMVFTSNVRCLGKVDAEDQSILHGAAREIFEETGLTISHFAGEFQCFTYTIERTYDGKPVMQTSLQLNFVAKVEGEQQVRLSPEEHQAYVWVAEDEFESLPSTDEMKEVMKNAFTYVKSLKA
jgi:8-oxo-dGTP pyrophosphatase MutT (NUDIX family)